MLKEIVASKAAKLIAACVCPVAGTTALTVAVPQVRSAVHKATAPRAYALPRTRTRAPAAVAPMQVAAAAAPCIEVTPIASLAALPAIATSDLASLADLPTLSSPGGIAGRPVVIGSSVMPIAGGGGAFTPPSGAIVPVVPEPATWVQLVLGFALLGGSIRVASRRGPDASDVDSVHMTISERPLA